MQPQTIYLIVAIPIDPAAMRLVHVLRKNGNMSTFSGHPGQTEGARVFKTFDGAERRMKDEAAKYPNWAWAVLPVLSMEVTSTGEVTR